jgi:hypothetical protein
MTKGKDAMSGSGNKNKKKIRTRSRSKRRSPAGGKVVSAPELR